MENDIISIKDLHWKLTKFRKYAIKKWLTILITVILFAVIGFAVAVLKKPVYISKLTFVVQESENQSGLGSLVGLASQFGLMSPDGSSTFNKDNIIEILKSRAIVEQSLLYKNIIDGKSEYLINHYLRYKGYYDEWKDDKKLSNFRIETSDEEKLTRLQDSVLNFVYKDIIKYILDVDKLQNQLNIVQVKVSSTNETFAKLFTENLIKSVTDFYVNTKTQRARETFDFLQHRADSTKATLEESEKGLAKWQDASNQLVKYQGQLEKVKLLRKVEILGVVYTEILKNLELAKMNLLNITPIVKIIDKPVLPLMVWSIPPVIGTIVMALAGFILIIIFLFFRMIISDAIHEES
jgi:uncharacterized protein involved in exopolysaccharide biosynthesis